MPLPRVSEPAMRADWLNGEIAVIGLARSGRSVATLLARTGNSVYASDVSNSSELEATARELKREGIDVGLGGHDGDRVGKASLVVVSPGVPPDAPVVAAARAKGVDVVSEVEIALRFLPNLRYVAITGTNGKTTTAALVAHLLRALDLRAVAAGNIGIPLSEIALAAAPPDWVALEVSSFQLHDTPGLRPVVGVLTNVSPNHLDRYDSAEEYYSDKKLLFRNATPSSQWVTNRDDAVVQRLAAGVAGVRCEFSLEQPADAYYDRASGQLVVLGCPVLNRSELRLLGDHNVGNALCATLAVMLAEPAHRAPEACRRLADGLRSFEAIEHRIEIVSERGGVLWVNDSKSTNVASTLVALQGMRRPTILLLGGRHKGEPYTALGPELKRTVKKVIAYGEAAPRITRDLSGLVTVEQSGGAFADVVGRARASAVPGDAILLSPACSSYDMFTNYEERGAEFKRLAGELMTAISAPPITRDVARADVRERWTMGQEAKYVVLISFSLLIVGLAVLYSASAIVAVNEGRSGLYYLMRQLTGAAVGVVAFAIAAKLDAERWREWAWPIMWFTLAALLLVLLMPNSIAPRINGSKRFLFASSFQPSELGKFAVVIWTAMLVVKKGEQLRRFSRGLLPFLVVLTALAVLAAAEPDLSVAMLYTLLMAVVLFAGGVRVGHFVLLGALAIPWIWSEIERVQYALLRLTSFLDPGGTTAAVSYQLRQSLVAVGSGGWMGSGFGQGRQQYGFLPYPYSDFIGSNIGEEWGFIGLCALTLMFGAYALFGFRIARAARSPFLQLVAVGLTFTTVLTAYIHIGVVVGLLPTTGLTLPFVSYGRSNLVLTMFLTGVLVNIGSARERVVGMTATDPFAAHS